MSRRCNGCGETKPYSEFYKSKKGRNGHDSRCKRCTSEYGKQWRLQKGNPYHRTQRYGMTPEEYEELLDEQLNCCACCGSSDPKRKAGFVIDHDHQSGRVRGLLCHSCNIGLGLLGDSVDGLTKAIEYLRRNYDNT